MPRSKRTRGPSHIWSIRTEEYKYQICQILGFSGADCFNDGFDGRVDMAINGGQLHSNLLLQILENTEKEIKILEIRREKIKMVLSGKIDKELEEKITTQNREEVLVDVMGDTHSWAKALPEKDRDAIFYPRWEAAQAKIHSLCGVKPSISDLQEYIRKTEAKE